MSGHKTRAPLTKPRLVGHGQGPKIVAAKRTSIPERAPAPSTTALPKRRPETTPQFEVSPVAAAMAWAIVLTSVAVIIYIVVSNVSDLFGPEKNRLFGKSSGSLFMLCAAACSAAFWFLRVYPKWVRRAHPPGGQLTGDATERGLPPALVAFGKVAPIFFLPTGLLGFALVLGKWTEKEWSKDLAASASAGAAVLITSLFVLFAAPVVWPRGDDRMARRTLGSDLRTRRKGSDSATIAIDRLAPTFRTFAPFFAACSGLLGIAMLMGRTRTILESADRWELILCGASLLLTAACAMGLSAKVKPQEESAVHKPGFDLHGAGVVEREHA